MNAALARLRGWFLPDINVEEAGDARRIVRAGMLVILVFFVVIGGWIAFAPLSGAVVAPGFVKVDMNRKTIQHQEGGIVQSILVRDGAKVQEGQTLIVINDVRVDAGFDLTRQQLDAEHARTARLNAEKALLPKVEFPADLAARRSDPRVAEIMKREEVLFAARRETLDSQITLLKRQTRETREEADALARQVKAEEQALKHQQAEVAANEELVKQNFQAKVRVLPLYRGVSEYESRIGEHTAELAKTRQRMTETEIRIINLKTQYSQQAADELKDSTGKLFELEERLRPSRDASDRQEVKAPVSGEVVDLRVSTVGQVVGPREPLLDIVPVNPRLIVEARIRPEDVAYVREGSTVDVRLTAFKYRLTPVVDGKVFYKSADRLTDRTQSGTLPYYAVYIEVDPRSLQEAGNLQLQAGMPAEVYIRTTERTALQYFLDPVLGFVRRGMREP